MMKSRVMLVGFLVGTVAGCGTQPAGLQVGDVDGELTVGVGGTVNPNINVDFDAEVQADVECTIVCDLNTGECETVCELAEGTPPTPEEAGAEVYLANCAACHGDPPGTGFAPNLAGEDADEIANTFADPSHPGGSFPNLTQEDIDNLAAYFATI